MMHWDLAYNAKQARIAGDVSKTIYVSTWWPVFSGVLLVVLFSILTAFVLIRQQANNVAAAAAQSSNGVQTVAAASEQLASSIAETNRQVAESASLTSRAVEGVRQTDQPVATLSDSTSRIGRVVELINNIATQTNLLALNATIEAPRAGIAANVEEVGSIMTSIAAAVEQQDAATTEIARTVQATAESTRAVTSNIAGVSQAANGTGTAAAQVLGAAGGLSRQAESLSVNVDSFLVSVRGTRSTGSGAPSRFYSPG